MDGPIYTPRGMVDMIVFMADRKSLTNPCVCTKIPYKGFEISISMDSSHCAGDLHRSDIRVYKAAADGNGDDVTSQFIEEGQCMVYGYGEDLHRIFNKIDELVAGGTK